MRDIKQEARDMEAFKLPELPIEVSTRREVSRIIHSELMDKHKIDAIMDLIDREVRNAGSGKAKRF